MTFARIMSKYNLGRGKNDPLLYNLIMVQKLGITARPWP